MFGSGELKGVNFGSDRGQVYIHARIKNSRQTSDGVWPLGEPDRLMGGLNAANYFVLDGKFIQIWNDKSIQLKIPANYVMDRISGYAGNHGVAPPDASDVEVGYQVRRRNDQAETNWLYSPLAP